jgi:2-polyprenyl-3-methyl-5-hydroxy-6-metoxy-1,4-benzoquinol methylase
MFDQEKPSAAAAVVPFSDAVAGYYDVLYPDFESSLVIEFLKAHGFPDGSVLEFGIGTGRIGIPLAEHGYRVHGIEASPKMIEVLRGKPGAEKVSVSEDDFTTMNLGEKFDVVLAPFNVLCCPLTPQDQKQAMNSIARHLDADGIAVVETFDPSGFHTQTQAVTNAHPIGDNGVLMENIRTLPEAQLMIVVNSLFSGSAAPQVSTLAMRYLWPSEIDLMAGIAGMELVDRFGGWNRRPFTAHVPQQMCTSVYRLAR